MDSRLAPLQEALSGRYTLQREVGQGGMATVYLAEDVRHGRRVAVKVLREELSASLGQERFLREIRVAAALQHPHVLPLFDSGEAAGQLFYVMPFVDGESLRQRLVKTGELPVADAVRVLRDIADALSEAHKHGVVHRDLKPDNVMLRGRHALVTDFGVAKAVGESTGRQSLTTMGVALGTPTYMAPEQAVADPNVDHRADIYAFGVVAYELLTGRPPFMGESPQATLAAHVTAAPPPIATLRTLTPALAALVMRCLEKRPADRWQSAEELVHALEAVLTPTAGMTPMETAPHATVAAPASTPAAASSRRALVVVALLLASAAGGFAWWTQRPGGGSPVVATAEHESATIDQIAILPFENIGGDTANAYFTDGMTDELANALSKVSGLRIASRTSSYAFREKAKRLLPEIRRTLGVAAILEGTVTRVADKLRVSARLTRTADGVEIWSDAFVRPAADVFAVQNEVGKAIVVALSPSLGGRGASALADTVHGTSDPQAYDLYLRGRYLWYQRGAENLEQAIRRFREAVARDSAFARAWAGVALANVTLIDGYKTPNEAAIAEARAAAKRAIALDSLLAEPHMVLGLLYGRLGRQADAEREFERAIALDPRSPTAHQWYGLILQATDRLADVTRELRTASELDPLSGIITANYAGDLAKSGKRQEAQAAVERALLLSPNSASVHQNAAGTFLDLAMPERALTSVDAAERLGNSPLLLIALRTRALVQLGDTARAREETARAARDTTSSSADRLAAVSAAMGNREGFFRAFARAARQLPYNAAGPEFYESDAIFAPYRSDPRFPTLLQQLRATQQAAMR